MAQKVMTEGNNVFVQNPFSAYAFQQDKNAPKPKYDRGTEVVIGEKESMDPRINSTHWTTYNVLMSQWCTNYVIFNPKDPTDTWCVPIPNGPTIWYLLQNKDNRLDLLWRTEKDVETEQTAYAAHKTLLQSRKNPYLLPRE